ncbi:MAG: hypothetical protein KBB55_03275 [Candidatus Buchananbacteria bacterium]|nr:hypothetical protein [Candidatus Buchananbacteria bacterium]
MRDEDMVVETEITGPRLIKLFLATLAQNMLCRGLFMAYIDVQLFIEEMHKLEQAGTFNPWFDEFFFEEERGKVFCRNIEKVLDSCLVRTNDPRMRGFPLLEYGQPLNLCHWCRKMTEEQFQAFCDTVEALDVIIVSQVKVEQERRERFAALIAPKE